MTNVEDAYEMARECLGDVKSHAESFRKGLESSKIRDLNQREHEEKGGTEFEDDDTDIVGYYNHEQEALRRMVHQADVALQRLPEKLTGFLTVDQITESLSDFLRAQVPRVGTLAVLHADPADFTVKYEFEDDMYTLSEQAVRFVRALATFLPMPRDTELTKVTIHGSDGSEVQAHFSTLTPGVVFSWKHTPTKLYKCVGLPYIIYSGPDPIWGVKCDEVKTNG